jgi:beta-glucosidase
MTSFAPVKGMTESDIAITVSAILKEATLAEKVAMMSGKGFFEQYAQSGKRWGAAPYRAGGGCERLGVPALYFTDGPRGVARGNSTCFPCTMARGATFDTDLERRIGEIMGIETRAQDCTLSGAVCVNLLRHPAWGRAQETYGEDPCHLGEMGAALAEGIQTHNVIATVKHFALNSMENARFKIDVRCDDRVMREVYLPHFKRILDAGCASVMSAYNKWNGEYCGQNRELLTDILRGEWGFDGFVHSDWVLGVYKPYGAAAGLDIENPEPLVWGEKLLAAVEAGAIEPSVLDTACRRILTTLYRFACAEDPLEAYAPALVARAEHRAVALEAALKSAVLLKNDAVLPLAATKTERLAILGRLAALENTGDNGSSRVQAPYVVTALQGLRARLGQGAVLSGDESDLNAAAAAAASADAVVVVVGYTAVEEGEYIPGDMNLGQNRKKSSAPDAGQSAPSSGFKHGGDRLSLGLPDDQIALIRAAAASGKPVAVVIVAGSAVLVEDWIEDAGAVLQTFYAGMEGGAALASLLFGDASPSGKLPFTVARLAEDYPFFDRDAAEITYDQFHGYTLFEKSGVEPRFPFGFGLSYATFRYRALAARRHGDVIDVTVSVRNDGAMAADEVVQVYVAPPGRDAVRAKKTLKAFTRVSLNAGQTRTVRLSVPVADLRWWNPATRDWTLESGVHEFLVGGSSETRACLRARIDL